MKISAAPIPSEIAPARMASAPSPAPTDCFDSTRSGTGSAPALRSVAKLLALSTVKLPVICPLPPVIGVWITGAEITRPSSTMAKRLPMLRVDTSANRR